MDIASVARVSRSTRGAAVQFLPVASWGLAQQAVGLGCLLQAGLLYQ